MVLLFNEIYFKYVYQLRITQTFNRDDCKGCYLINNIDYMFTGGKSLLEPKLVHYDVKFHLPYRNHSDTESISLISIRPNDQAELYEGLTLRGVNTGTIGI